MGRLLKFVPRILASASILLAACIVLAVLATQEDGHMFFVALGFLIPGAWWFHCESKDKKAKKQYEQSTQAHEQWREYLDPVTDHTLIAGMGDSIPEPTPVKRRWGWVAFISFLAFAAAALFVPENPASSEPVAPETSSVAPTTTSEETTSSTTTSSTTSTTSTSSTTSTTSSPTSSTPTAEPTTEEPVDEPYVEEIHQERQPVYTPTPEPVQQQFYQQPAAPVVQDSPSVYYQNCSAVRAAGAAPLYIGSPGYAPKLDRDGDGVACE